MIAIGTSGWEYDHWTNVFYPNNLKRNKRFEYYTTFFNTVEVNYSFYRIPKETTFSKWRKHSPDKFIFSLKASRYITYSKKPKTVSYTLYLFSKRAYLLGEKRGPILIQFPKRYKKDTMALVSLIAFLRNDYRWALEFRDESWFDEEVYKILRNKNIALAFIDSPDINTPTIQTADFVYFRLHGRKIWYASSYTQKELKEISKKIKFFSNEGRDVYVYFNNDYRGYAVKNALYLKKILGQFPESKT